MAVFVLVKATVRAVDVDRGLIEREADVEVGEAYVVRSKEKLAESGQPAITFDECDRPAHERVAEALRCSRKLRDGQALLWRLGEP